MTAAAFHDVDPGRAPSLQVLPRALEGEVFVLRRLLQSVGVYERLVTACASAIEGSGCDIGAWSIAAGFDQLHRFVRIGDVPLLTTAVQRALVDIYHETLARLLRDGLGFARPLYAMEHPVARLFVPYDTTQPHRSEYQRYSDERGHGKLTVLRPHRDSWFAESSRTINLWIAVSPVVVGNGLSIYPDSYGRALDFVPMAGVAWSQPVGTPVNFELASGDVLLFHAEHLHGSELNRTDRTRLTVSFRIETSRFLALRPTRRFRSFHPCSPAYARLVDPAARRTRRWLHWISKRGRAEAPRHRPDADSRPTWRPDVAPVRTLSNDFCSVELGDGRERVFARRCPHEGADLALGHVRNGSIVCPWDNLPFDLETGRSPCETVLPIGIDP